MVHAGRIGLVLLLAIFIGIQLAPTERLTPPFDPTLRIEHHVNVPPDVQAILDRSCKDCHSDETTWPWYARIAPASWLLANHVREGREQMNLSEWGAMDSDAAKDVLVEVCRQIKKGARPVPSYPWIPRSAVPTPADVTTLCTWADATRKAIRAAE